MRLRGSTLRRFAESCPSPSTPPYRIPIPEADSVANKPRGCCYCTIHLTCMRAGRRSPVLAAAAHFPLGHDAPCNTSAECEAACQEKLNNYSWFLGEDVAMLQMAAEAGGLQVASSGLPTTWGPLDLNTLPKKADCELTMEPRCGGCPE